MNARAVDALSKVIHASMQRKQTAAGIAMDVDAAGMLMSPETAAELAALRADADRLKRVAEREHKAFLDTHDALNLLREDANRVMAEHGVEALQAELERVRGKAVKFKEQRGERTRFLATVSADLERANARVAELEAERADRHDDLAGALGHANEDWADLIGIAAANTATIAKGGARPASYRSSPLPSRDAICAGDDCGHSGAEHHHGDTRCWAHLPRLHAADGTWSGIRICPCKAFVGAGDDRG